MPEEYDRHEDRVRQLEVANARLAVSVEHLAASVAALTTTVQVLRDTMNQGRGAMWLLMAASGAIGAVSVTIVKKLLGIL
jgi:NADPH-dependent curcumin reductase CurA